MTYSRSACESKYNVFDQMSELPVVKTRDLFGQCFFFSFVFPFNALSFLCEAQGFKPTCSVQYDMFLALLTLHPASGCSFSKCCDVDILNRRQRISVHLGNRVLSSSSKRLIARKQMGIPQY